MEFVGIFKNVLVIIYASFFLSDEDFLGGMCSRICLAKNAQGLRDV